LFKGTPRAVPDTGHLLPRSCSFEPSDPRRSHESSQRAGCLGTVRSHRRRDHPASSVPLGQCVEHLGSRLKPWGCFAHSGPHVVVAVANPSGSGAARHSPLEPHDCLHRAALQRILPDPVRPATPAATQAVAGLKPPTWPPRQP
jgi:hypothetical protein